MEVANLKITPNHIHAHWHFKRPATNPSDGEPLDLPPPVEPEVPSILEPAVVRTRGRPRREGTSTTRDRSHWEIRGTPQRGRRGATLRSSTPARGSRPGRRGGVTSRARSTPVSFTSVASTPTEGLPTLPDNLTDPALRGNDDKYGDIDDILNEVDLANVPPIQPHVTTMNTTSSDAAITTASCTTDNRASVCADTRGGHGGSRSRGRGRGRPRRDATLSRFEATGAVIGFEMEWQLM